VKFKDADLLGIPLRATIGGKSLARGVIELKQRADGAMTEVPADGAVEAIRQALGNAETA
jgi:prolyl-tRNA synthetase